MSRDAIRQAIGREGPAARPAARRRVRGGLLLLAALGIVAPGSVRAQPAEGEAATAARQRMAILPVVVHSAEDRDYLRAGLADMLNARFQQYGRFDVERVDDAGLGTTRLRSAVETGRELGVDYVLFGSFTRFGTGASLDMQCAHIGPEGGVVEPGLREIFVYSGSIGEVIPDLDELVGKVHRFALPGFDEGAVDVAAGPPTPAAGPPSADLEALLDRVRTLEEQVRQLEVEQRAN